jgi:hypothetical protein
MRLELTASMFIDHVRQCGRYDQFGYAGWNALFEYCEENYPDSECDVIAMCCEWTLCATLEEFNEGYNNGNTDNDYSIADIESVTTLIPIGNSESFLIQQF